ncbi:MAG: substrate-binding domain-containing protein [Coprothermobacterota bacterium]|nr:substrate-binding domain-containing protein [Coprothermobacterota bacterium]
MRKLSILVLVLLSLTLFLSTCGGTTAPSEMILATTTSTADTGLLDALLPKFEQEFNATVKVIAVGTGEAIAMGQKGDADVLLVHNRTAEDQFMKDGNGSIRKDVMYNDFLLVGPKTDPAQAKGLEIIAALQAIAESKDAIFVSRGDKSGTNSKELALWKKASITPTTASMQYLSTGQGMGETLRITTEKQGYTLADRGTWLATEKTLDLQIVSEKSNDLFNPYGVIVVNPAKFPKVNAKLAEEFANWITSPEIQKFIGEFGKDKYGQALFVPSAGP